MGVERYCPVNTTLSGVTQGNVSRCLLDTITDPLLLVVVLVAGLHQCRLYKKYSTPRDSFLIHKSWLFYGQMSVLLAIPFVGIASFVVETVGLEKEVTGLDILNLVTVLCGWTCSVVLVLLERGWQLPVPARNGHGPVLLIFWTLAFVQVNLRLVAITKESWWYHLTSWLEVVSLVLYSLNYALITLALLLGSKAPGLLRTNQYSAFANRGSDQSGAALLRTPSGNSSTWRGFWQKLGRLLPYMWPAKSHLLQIRVVFCILLLAGVRVTNVFVPIFYKKIVDRLSAAGMAATADWPWQEVSIWMALKLLQGGGTGSQGLLNNWRTFLWIKVQQYTTMEIQVSLFAHLHNLSLRWHLGRKTGEVLRVMDRGTNSINSLLQYLVFSILPTLIDILVAIIYFGVEFNIYFGVIVLVTMAIYLSLTIALTEWRTKYRRSMNEADNKQRTRGVDSLLNAETVKYYSMELWEVEKYKETILYYQGLEWKSLASLTLLNIVQSLVINVGLFGTSLYCAYLVSDKQYTVGDFVLLGTYFLQLMTPLNWLGSLYRIVQESFINMENMFELMTEEVEVRDKPHAIQYHPASVPPEIEFRSVSFAYQAEKPVLEGISLKIPSGTATALVGATGSGKSTIAKLLFRLFDVNDGQILVDNVDIRDYQQHSYRSMIGVVPQDTVLFNNTLRYNVLYGNVDATDSQVFEATRAAEIHEAVLGFPDGYDTMVGERGLKLSGGEKQRIAIARTLLKEPRMVIFDEATSSLDSETERNIQNALNRVASHRTSLIIAHRLSTVVHCDQILVLDQGKIVEMGTHASLLDAGGKYASLWQAQLNSHASDDDNPIQH